MRIATILLVIMMFGCSSPPKVGLPQIGTRAIPDIFLPEPPVFTPFTKAEFDAIPITLKGKILKYKTDVGAAWEIAGAAVQGYREYIKSLFNEKK